MDAISERIVGDELFLGGLAEYAPRFDKGTELWLVKYNGRMLWVLSLAHEDIVDEVVVTATVGGR
jgi:hypothetical protein